MSIALASISLKIGTLALSDLSVIYSELVRNASSVSLSDASRILHGEVFNNFNTLLPSLPPPFSPTVTHYLVKSSMIWTNLIYTKLSIHFTPHNFDPYNAIQQSIIIQYNKQSLPHDQEKTYILFPGILPCSSRQEDFYWFFLYLHVDLGQP